MTRFFVQSGFIPYPSLSLPIMEKTQALLLQEVHRGQKHKAWISRKKMSPHIVSDSSIMGMISIKLILLNSFSVIILKLSILEKAIICLHV